MTNLANVLEERTARGEFCEKLDGAAIRCVACGHDCRVLTSTYNEPLIISEWAIEVFKVGRDKGLAGSYVSNGNGTPEVIEYIAPWVDFYQIDLKNFNERNYRRLGGHLEPVLETIREIHRRGIWLELLTLVAPGFNDSNHELTASAEFIADIDPNIPWHVTAFHKEYKMADNDNTTVRHLLRAWEAGREALLVGRVGFRVTSYRIENDSCPDCGTKVPGVWEPPRASHGRPIPLR